MNESVKSKVVFWRRGLRYSAWNCCVAEDDLELLVLQLPPPKSGIIGMCQLPHPDNRMLGFACQESTLVTELKSQHRDHGLEHTPRPSPRSDHKVRLHWCP